MKVLCSPIAFTRDRYEAITTAFAAQLATVAMPRGEYK